MNPAIPPDLWSLLVALVESEDACAHAGVARMLAGGTEAAHRAWLDTGTMQRMAILALVDFTRRAQSAPPECEGLTARWCPRCGTCSCEQDGDLNDPACPLHAPSSQHAEAAPPSPVDGEIERLVEDLIGEGCKALAPSEPKVRAARTALLAAIRRALADRDARIAALEAEVADKDTATVLAQNAAERRGKRIAALEAGLREACDALQDWMPSSDAAHDLGIRLRSLADATKK